MEMSRQSPATPATRTGAFAAARTLDLPHTKSCKPPESRQRARPCRSLWASVGSLHGSINLWPKGAHHARLTLANDVVIAMAIGISALSHSRRFLQAFDRFLLENPRSCRWR